MENHQIHKPHKEKIKESLESKLNDIISDCQNVSNYSGYFSLMNFARQEHILSEKEINSYKIKFYDTLDKHYPKY